MTKNQLLTVVLGLVLTFNMTGQELKNCEERMNEAQFLIKGTQSFQPDHKKALELIQKCVDQRDPNGQFHMAKLMLEGSIVAKNEKEAFALLQLAAEQGHGKAACTLGEMHKDGIGGVLDFNLARSWFEKAASLGNSKGAYSLGYLYLKGLGSIDQDYTQAVSWFEKSDYLMAKHWLAICYYFGYGVAQDQDLAIELLAGNTILNSETMVKHFIDKKDLKIKSINEQQLKSSENDSTTIAATMIPEEVVEVKDDLDPNVLSGSWAGKLLEFDWSGQKIERVVPVGIELNYNKQNDVIDYNFTVGDSITKELAIWFDQSLYFDNLTINLERLYTDHPEHLKLNYSILSAKLEQKELGGTTYLVGTIETKIEEWNEPGPPISIVLRDTSKIKTEDWYK